MRHDPPIAYDNETEVAEMLAFQDQWLMCYGTNTDIEKAINRSVRVAQRLWGMIYLPGGRYEPE